jgi:hypothetical protein
MKISKTLVLMLWWLFSLAGLWLMFASAAEKQLWDPYNEVHHVLSVTLLSWSNRSTLSKVWNGILWIKADNFVISQTWDLLNKAVNTHDSSILWWIKNQIDGWKGNVILWWQGNAIKKQGNMNLTDSAILWWSGNQILQSSNKNSDKSVILWWVGNTLRWSNSVAWWESNRLEWDFSTVLWNNSEVKWDRSVALWSGAKVNANNSFLWTDGSQTENLWQAKVFAVVSKNWVVVNADKANSFSQLTIWGPLIVYKTDVMAKDEGLGCTADTKWVLKVIKRDNSQNCFCSCDGEFWHSLYWQWVCVWKCDTSLAPKCGTDFSRIEVGGSYLYSWSCEIWKIVKWTWDYVVTKDNVVHRSCQTNNGKALECTWSVS